MNGKCVNEYKSCYYLQSYGAVISSLKWLYANEYYYYIFDKKKHVR